MHKAQGANCAISNLVYGSSVCTNDNHSLKLVAFRLVHTNEPYTTKLHIFSNFQSSAITLFLSSASSLDPDFVGGHNAHLRSVILQCTGLPDHGINVTVDNLITAE